MFQFRVFLVVWWFWLCYCWYSFLRVAWFVRFSVLWVAGADSGLGSIVVFSLVWILVFAACVLRLTFAFGNLGVFLLFTFLGLGL